MIIIDFLENYKTAFALERRDYLETIFYEAVFGNVEGNK